MFPGVDTPSIVGFPPNAPKQTLNIQNMYIHVCKLVAWIFQRARFERIGFVVEVDWKMMFLDAEDAPVPKSELYRPDNATYQPLKAAAQSLAPPECTVNEKAERVRPIK